MAAFIADALKFERLYGADFQAYDRGFEVSTPDHRKRQFKLLSNSNPATLQRYSAQATLTVSTLTKLLSQQNSLNISHQYPPSSTIILLHPHTENSVLPSVPPRRTHCLLRRLRPKNPPTMASSTTKLSYYVFIIFGTVAVAIIALFLYFALRTFWLSNGEVMVRSGFEGEDDVLLNDE